MTDRVTPSPRPLASIPGALTERAGSAGAPAAGASFADALQTASSAGGLKFSGHALQRLDRREIDLGGTRMARLEDAVSKAEAKGSRDSLILIDELALVVSVRNRTVITAMDSASRKENVFTNIDSVVIN